MARVILHIHSLEGGGAERVWAILASGLAGLGHECLFVVERVDDANRPFLDSTVSYKVLTASSHVAQVAEMAALWRHTQPQVVLTACGNANFKAALVRAGGQRKPGLIISIHGAVASGLLGRTGMKLFPLVARVADRVVYNSSGMRALMEHKWLVPQANGCVINNPVWFPACVDPGDCERLYPSFAGRRLILSVGRLLVEQKGQDDLLKAFARFAQTDPNHDLVLVGDGPSRTALQSLACELGVRTRVHFIGYSRDPWPFYARAAIFAHCARHEAFGNVLVEALGYGLPIVATDTPGAREVLSGGTFGRLVPIGDVDAMTRGLHDAVQSQADSARLKRRAAEFAPAHAIAQYDRLIGELIDERGC
jgi:glycosyltransferase involved in cell wall biosynthesis